MTSRILRNDTSHQYHSRLSSNEKAHIAETDQSHEHFQEAGIQRNQLMDKSSLAFNINPTTSHDNVRVTSGKNPPRHDIPISIDT